MNEVYDLCIVGAGASGMAAALEARLARAGLSVLLLEKNAEPGRKIRATGSGRCNITNEAAPGAAEVRAFLRRWGILTRVWPESGLVYPHSESAADVADLLAARVTEQGGEIRGSFAVSGIRRLEEPGIQGYVLHGVSGGREATVRARTVILACGGKAGPSYGTTGDGYRLASSLGHRIVTPIPVLTSVECAEDACEPLKGTRSRGVVTLYRKGEKIFCESGEIQFTWYGLSGICVFNMTREMRFTREEGLDGFRISIDLCPEEDLRAFLLEQRRLQQAGGSAPGRSGAAQQAPAAAGAMLRTVIRPNLAAYVLKRAGIDPQKPVQALTDAEIGRVAGQVHALVFRPTGIRGWKEAQCTSGGVSLEEIDPVTQESLLSPGLYITGELQDYDGPCGGYNLNHAWRTGMAAGRAAAASLSR